MKDLLYLKDKQLKALIEKLFLGYRESFSDSKTVLKKYSIGIAHHKVILLISMYRAITISELLKKLKITKQSLNRVLNDLLKLKLIFFKKDEEDSRIKHIFLLEILFHHHHLQLKYELYNYSLIIFFKTLLKLSTSSDFEFKRAL